QLNQGYSRALWPLELQQPSYLRYIQLWIQFLSHYFLIFLSTLQPLVQGHSIEVEWKITLVQSLRINHLHPGSLENDQKSPSKGLQFVRYCTSPEYVAIFVIP